ncbi:unnamed protein product, partial [Mesorhabditis belari]|uniref:ZP domain-containing protein n=1 Tax=Mesorhabditis belari TaxID=2138241 RepID=A0AAF3EYT2_9BILA
MCLAAWLFLLPTIFASIQFENSLTGAPKIHCAHGAITLDVSTEKQAPSFIFAKNHFNKDGCSFRNSTHVTFNFDHCNVNRKREVQPKRGMSYSLTVMVQLHPLFITKVDRAYHVHCFYMESEKAVGAEMSVGELNSTKISQELQPPMCQYTLHKDSIHGPNVQRVKIGDPIYHVWECPTDAFAMLIHSCVVYDGQSGTQVSVVDENGCSMDPFLMPELTYTDDLTKTYTPSHAFNFPDIQQVYFNCKIKLCPRGPTGENDCSAITPPRCGGASRTTSSIQSAIDEFNPHKSLTESREKGDSAETRSLNEVIEKEQLIPTVNSERTTAHLPTQSTHVQTTVRDVTEGKTTVIIFQTTTVLPPTTKPPTTTVVRAERFPTPGTLTGFGKHYNGTEVIDEGSGLEIGAEHDSPSIKVLSNDRKPGKQGKAREIKRRDIVEMDVASPELTVLEKDYDLPEPLSQQSPLPTPPPLNAAQNSSSVCLPVFSLWALALLMVLCLSLLTVAICRTCARRDKFMPY